LLGMDSAFLVTRPRASLIMSYQSAVARMFALGHELAQTPAHKFDLAHMRVPVAGDGSSESLPERADRRHQWQRFDGCDAGCDFAGFGIKTGLYTSPHLVRINERIRVKWQKEIGDDEFASLQGEVDRVAEKLVGSAELPWHPSFFEMMTAIGFEYFARQQVDLAVLEVGMGGRLDGDERCRTMGQRDHGPSRSITRNIWGIQWAKLRGRRWELFVRAER